MHLGDDLNGENTLESNFPKSNQLNTYVSFGLMVLLLDSELRQTYA